MITFPFLEFKMEIYLWLQCLGMCSITLICASRR